MKRLSVSRFFVALLVFGFGSNLELQAEKLEVEFLSSGVTRKVGGYRPVKSEMDEDAEIVKVSPKDLEDPSYGVFQVGDKKWAYIIDAHEDEDKDDTLYLDTNGDGDLTNDPEPKWASTKRGTSTMYSGNGEIELGDGQLGAINFYRFDPNDKRRESLKNTILYYTDFGFEYKFKLDDKEFSTFLSGTPTKSTRLPIDRDGNGRTSSRFEMTSVGKPFNFTGTTYVFDLDGEKLTLEKSKEEIEQLPLPPDLRVGKQALEFTATTMDGDEISFPGTFAGKIVMIDFWATWCGPCIGEIPNMKEAYTNWHENGFEILGISFDRADQEEEIQAFLKKNEQSWPQIYEGKRWETELGMMHDVSGIPFVLLVDGDSGKILATSRQLRGPGLSDFIKEQLEKKFDIELKEKSEDDEKAADKETSDDKAENE